MSVSPYSIVMAMICFTLASLTGYFILRQAEKCGLAFIGMVFLLTTIRIFAPLDITGSIIIRSKVVYPAIQNWMRHSVIGPITIGGCLILLWIAGAVFRFAGLVRKWMQQRKFRQGAELQNGDSWLTPLFEIVSDEWGYHGSFYIAAGENVSSVYQAGFLHPYILLPTQIDMFSDEDICNMFRHELCHFLSRDLWIKVGFQAIGCVLWWNPVMPLLKRSIEQLLELRCDRKVCKRLPAEVQLSYMETLSALVKQGSSGIAQVYMGYLGVDNDIGMVQRFRMLLLSKPSTTERGRQIISYVLGIALFAASYCVILQPWVQPPIDQETESAFWATELTPGRCYIRHTSHHELELYCGDVFYCTISKSTQNQVPFYELPVTFEQGGPGFAAVPLLDSSTRTLAGEDFLAFFPTEEMTWCARKYYGTLQVRIWSHSRGLWLTDWVSCCSSMGDIYPLSALTPQNQI